MESIEIMDLESMAYIKSESEFGHARMKAFLETIMGMLTGNKLHLLSFSEVVDKLRLSESVYRGLHDIPLENIVGSTGRYDDFTRRFLPRRTDKRDKERWRNIYTLAVTGKGFPPIEVYKIDQVYFVKDGNHRVSVARELGWESIQAYVTELPSPISLEPDVEPMDLVIKEECAYFLDETKLDQTRPDSKDHLDFTEAGGYQRLLRHVHLHQHLLQQASPASNPVSLPAAAADWYDHVYLPLIQTFRESDVIKHFPGRNEADLYIWLVKHQKELREKHNLEQVQLPDAAREFLSSAE
jgi:hypothetical protein